MQTIAVIDPQRIRVEPLPPSDSPGKGIHCFRVLFETRSGRCFITAGEAMRLRQLDAHWVKQALINLALHHGRVWLEDALLSDPGLILHHSDAYEPLAGAIGSPKLARGTQ
jgi:hypothetical protein